MASFHACKCTVEVETPRNQGLLIHLQGSQPAPTLASPLSFPLILLYFWYIYICHCQAVTLLFTLYCLYVWGEQVCVCLFGLPCWCNVSYVHCHSLFCTSLRETCSQPSCIVSFNMFKFSSYLCNTYIKRALQYSVSNIDFNTVEGTDSLQWQRSHLEIVGRFIAMAIISTLHAHFCRRGRPVSV